MPDEDIEKMNRGKKFDICLMNPPYDRSMHLKFLAKTIELSGKVVSVQPTRWLEEVVGKDKKTSAYNKYKDKISIYIKDLEVITAAQAKKLFNILLPTNVGIYVCDEEGGFDYDSLSSNSILEKVLNYMKNNKCNFEMDKKDGWRVRVPFIIGSGKAAGSGLNRRPVLTNVPVKELVFYNGKKDGKWWYEYYLKNQYSKTTENITSSIQFNTEIEGLNFAKQFKTSFVQYIENCLIVDVHIDDKKILWMGNAKHPRTGEIGYKSEWLDEDFDKFFGLDKDEIKKYHDFISNHNKEVEQWYKDHNKTKKSE